MLVLALAAAVLLAVFGGRTTALIPLYAAAYSGITVSQIGMVRHHATEREPGWRRGQIINGIGHSDRRRADHRRRVEAACV